VNHLSNASPVRYFKNTVRLNEWYKSFKIEKKNIYNYLHSIIFRTCSYSFSLITLFLKLKQKPQEQPFIKSNRTPHATTRSPSPGKLDRHRPAVLPLLSLSARRRPPSLLDPFAFNFRGLFSISGDETLSTPCFQF
jgi:hypothetical protein